jgi:hypothetical protein
LLPRFFTSALFDSADRWKIHKIDSYTLCLLSVSEALQYAIGSLKFMRERFYNDLWLVFDDGLSCPQQHFRSHSFDIDFHKRKMRQVETVKGFDHYRTLFVTEETASADIGGIDDGPGMVMFLIPDRSYKGRHQFH